MRSDAHLQGQVLLPHQVILRGRGFHHGLLGRHRHQLRAPPLLVGGGMVRSAVLLVTDATPMYVTLD